jgi:hypothetical protein
MKDYTWTIIKPFNAKDSFQYPLEGYAKARKGKPK